MDSLLEAFTESDLGAIIDPIADKILVTFTLVGLSLEIDLAFISLLIGLIISRDIFVSGLRMFNLKNNYNHTEVTFLAKLKTAFQFFSISSYLLAFLLKPLITHIYLTFSSNICMLTYSQDWTSLHKSKFKWIAQLKQLQYCT